MIIASTYRPDLASSTIQSFLGPACAAKDTVLEQSDLASEWAREEVRRAPPASCTYLCYLSVSGPPRVRPLRGWAFAWRERRWEAVEWAAEADIVERECGSLGRKRGLFLAVVGVRFVVSKYG
jgi:hypothetical protein